MKSNTKNILKEIMRFLIIGGLATLLDYFVSGCVLYLFEPSKYSHFYSVFLLNKTASNYATIISTILGFIAGLIFNYVFSIFYVYINKGNSKSTFGFFMFAVLSFVGMCINAGGMYLGYTLLHINYWAIRIALTLIVMCYNYVSKKLIIFKNNQASELKINHNKTIADNHKDEQNNLQNKIKNGDHKVVDK